MPAFQFLWTQEPAFAALSCATPAKDGSPSSAITGIVNTYYPSTATASAGSTSITLGPATGASTGITSGDLLLVVQMQDAAINSNNSISYGNGSSGSGSTSVNNAGLYEYVVANNSVSTSGGTLNLRSGLINTYTNADATSTQGQRRFQVIRVPQYFNVTLSSGLSASRWNGTSGGILAIDVTGTLTGNSATVSVDGLGFRGGGARALSGGSGGSGTDYRSAASNTYHASKGEGIAGTPRYTYIPGATTVTDNSTDGYPNGSLARGAPGNAGGGGSDANPSSNDQNTGGGGGGNGGAGGKGGYSWSSVSDYGGLGGATFSGSASRLVLGGGGGAGARNNSAGVQSSGGAGGGMVFIRTGQITGSASLSANGSNGISPDNDGGGGAGAGGSLAITALGGTGSLTLRANGGVGGNAWASSAPGTSGELTTGSSNNRHGPGGGGGGGFILQPSSTDGFAGSVSTSVTGGANGISTTANSPYGATSGSIGQTTTISAANVPGIASGAQCVADLTLTKTHTGSFTVGSTGTYTMTVGNSGATSTSGTITVSDTLPTGLTVNNGAAGSVLLGGTNAANWTCTSSATNPQVITCTSSTTIAASASSVFNFPVSVGLGTAVGTNSITNTASVSGGGQTNTANDSSSDPTTILSPDLTITKSHTGNFIQGGIGAYSLTVSNGGTAATSGTVTVVDTLPTGLSVASGTVSLTGTNAASWNCTASGQTITCTSSTAIAVSGSSTFGFNVNVASNAPSSVTNSVAVSGGNEATSKNGNNSATDPTTIVAPPDLTLTKSHTGSFTVGSTGTYTMTVGNSGGSATSGTITFTDTLPTGLTANNGAAGSVTLGEANAANWTCTSNAANPQVITCTSSTAIAASGSSVFSFPVSVGLGTAVGNNSITNTASVSGGGQTNTANDSASDPTTVLSPDLTIAKNHTGNFTQGGIGAYNLTVSNGGTAATSGTVTVVDTLPTGLSVASGNVSLTGTNAANWSCTASGQTITCTSSTAIAVSGSSTFGFNVNVASNAPTSVTNSVAVSGGNEATANNGNNSATDPTVVSAALVTVSGTVFDDADGSKIKDGSEGLFTATGLNAVLVNSNTGNVVATTPVSSGAFSFSNVQGNANYTVLITTNTATVGSTPPAVALPSNWVSTGENLNGTADTTIDSQLSVSVVTSNVSNVNFGIEQLPDTSNVSASNQNNPGGTTQVQVPTLSGTDPEDGTLGTGKSFKIIALPSNGTLYYNGSTVSAGQILSGYTPSLLTLDPNDGTVTVTFTYAAVDAASQVDATPATVTLPFLTSANVLLVKRITAVNGDRTQNPNDGTLLNQFVDDTTSPRQADDNSANWPANYLIGAINAGKVKPGDTLEYTIYFLNAGSSSANNVRVCDRITGVQTFLADAYGTGQDIQLKLGTGSIVNLTQVSDSGDRAEFYTDSSSAPATCNLKPITGGKADNGTLMVDLTGSGNGTQPDLSPLPGSTGVGTPANAYGWFRFRTKVQE